MNVSGIAHVLPSRIVTNEEVLESVRQSAGCGLAAAERELLVKMTAAGFEVAGTSVRYHLADDERPFELCVRAGEAALKDAGMSAEDVDLLIYASIGRGFIEPATANVFQDLLGAKNATCFDLIDACASWVRAFDVAQKFLVSGGRYRTVMLITGEFIGRYAYRYNISSLAEFEHWFPGVTVGEGATATILTRGDYGDEYASDFRTWGSKRGLCMIPLENYRDYLGFEPERPDAYVAMQFSSFGGDLLRFGSSKLVEHYRNQSDFNSQEYDLIFGHPASDGICRAIGKRCRLDFSKFQFTHQLFGNTASSSLPLAISIAREEGRLCPESRVLMMFASAGVSTALVRFVQSS
jgi:3-oxoacyl-[acyl-carrier-protein] synthase III